MLFDKQNTQRMYPWGKNFDGKTFVSFDSNFCVILTDWFGWYLCRYVGEPKSKAEVKQPNLSCH